MKRIKRHKIKTEQPETSSFSRKQEEHDLAYYIHDRVELMHQVFSILKYKDLKAMAPECVRNLPVGDLQELCTEELLGISSKRLLATLDGAEPPSDTESSSRSPSPDPMETISLDSISSDEEILSQSSKKKKHKHRRSSKSKSKKREKQFKDAEDTTAVSKASRAGLTVLELLELQARARAIRAQLQNEQAKKQVQTAAVDSNTDDEVEIKEEEPDVVEISSGDEKPDLTTLQLAAQKPAKPKEPQKPEQPKEPSTPKEPVTPKERLKPTEPETTDQEKTITRRVSDLIITVPQAKATRKIKLNRNKVTVTVPNIPETESRIVTVEQIPVEVKEDKKKKKKNKKKKEKEGSDHDEITLQLSDSEKMDLLEDLNYDRLSSSASESSSDSDNDKPKTIKDNSNTKETENDSNAVEYKAQSPVAVNETNEDIKTQEPQNLNDKVINESSELNDVRTQNSNDDIVMNVTESSEPNDVQTSIADESNVDTDTCVKIDNLSENIKDSKKTDENETEIQESDVIELSREVIETEQKAGSVIQPSPEVMEEQIEANSIIAASVVETAISNELSSEIMEEQTEANSVDAASAVETAISNENETNVNQVTVATKERDISEGELSDRASSEVEEVDITPVVVCISDDEKQKSKKKKKDKKSKKEKKKSKQKIDKNIETREAIEISTKDVTDDDVYEILELSDDSSCYEVEGTVLSKEPTAEEIEALSARIDEINKDETPDNEANDSEPETEPVMSWKDRYLDSNKVKKVLTTANILNALRKKNKELKKKIEAKKIEKETQNEKVLEGSIEQYETLPASKLVIPVAEVEKIEEKIDEEVVTKEMKKDAKQLLKMYRKLLNTKKIKRREKKKKRKLKKQSENVSQTADSM